MTGVEPGGVAALAGVAAGAPALAGALAPALANGPALALANGGGTYGVAETETGFESGGESEVVVDGEGTPSTTPLESYVESSVGIRSVFEILDLMSGAPSLKACDVFSCALWSPTSYQRSDLASFCRNLPGGF